MKAADCVDRTERMQGVGWLCGTHCGVCLGLNCHEFRMPLQLHALCAPHSQELPTTRNHYIGVKDSIACDSATLSLMVLD